MSRGGDKNGASMADIVTSEREDVVNAGVVRDSDSQARSALTEAAPAAREKGCIP